MNKIEQYKDGNYPELQCSVRTCNACVKAQPLPGKATLLLHVHYALNCFNDHEPRYFFDNLELGLKVDDFSQQSAIRIAELMGASNIIFFGFDSINRNDCAKFAGNAYPAAYAEQAMLMNKFNYRLPYEYK